MISAFYILSLDVIEMISHLFGIGSLVSMLKGKIVTDL